MKIKTKMVESLDEIYDMYGRRGRAINAVNNYMFNSGPNLKIGDYVKFHGKTYLVKNLALPVPGGKMGDLTGVRVQDLDTLRQHVIAKTKLTKVKAPAAH